MGNAATPASGATPASRSTATPPPRPAVPASTGEIDFRSIPAMGPAPPSGFFPILNQPRVYDGPVTLDPMPVVKSDEDDDDDDESPAPSQDATSTKRKKKKPGNTKVIIAIVVAVIVLAAIGGGVYWMFIGNASPPPA